ncbi:MAG TPA: conjugal transfer protein TraF, partial [Gemmatimonadaceae bacterium]
QNANASSTATALSGAFTARATGYNAVNWNPANLAMPGNPGFSFTLLPIDLGAGLRPIDLSHFAPYSGKIIPASVREQWMTEVVADSGQKGNIGFGLTPIAFSMGPFAFQASTKFSSELSLAPDFVRTILFGNVDSVGSAGPTGKVKNRSFAGTSFRGAAYSTAALSYGRSLMSLIPLSNFAGGVTVKYTVGHALAYGLDDGSAIDTSKVQVSFPAIVTDPDSANGIAGAGVGLDLGGAWTIPGFRFGVSVQNVVNTFKWDTTKLKLARATSVFRSDTSYSQNFDSAYTKAPKVLKDKVVAQKFKPVVAAGVVFDWLPKMSVSFDVRQQVGDGIEVGPQSSVAAGIELRAIPFIPLRGGASVFTGGVGVSGGLGLNLLGFEVGLGGYLRKRGGGSEPGVTLSLVSINP